MTERISFVEIDLDRCSLTYGSSPCTAEIGVTGTKKCFNCYATCQDTANYDSETETIRFSTATANPPTSITAIPNIQSINIRPAMLDLGESIGIRAKVTVNFKDHAFPDTGPGGDHYITDRDYDPYTQGTFWGKFRARYPYLRGSDVRIIRGDTTQSIAQMETRHFVVETVAGPNSGGQFTVVAKDALKLADGERAQAPLLTDGYLQSSITDSATSLTLDPSGIGSEYPSSGIANIGGKEIVSFTRSGDVLTITRAQYNTTAVAHDADEKVQVCLEYSGEDPADIIYDLLVNYASIPSSYIPLAAWQAETSAYNGRTYTALIAEPTDVTQLINEILVQAATTIWWDDVNKIIRLRVLRDVDTKATTYNDDLIIQGSFSAKDQPEKRVSRVWTFYGQINPLEDLEDRRNYTSAVATISAESETNYGKPAIRKIYSRWIPTAGLDAATRLNDLILSRYSTPPRLLSFRLMRNEQLIEPELGGGYFLQNWTLQDDTGTAETISIQAKQVNSSDAYFDVIAEEVLYTETITPVDPSVRPIVIDTSQDNINIRDIYDTLYDDPDASTEVPVTVSAGVTIGSSSTSTYAFETGDWPAGVTLTLTNFGRIQGAGGNGGNGLIRLTSGPSWTAYEGSNGGNGGHAILAEYDIDIDNQGEIWGGGGGGGGGGSAYLYYSSPSAQYGVGVGGDGGGGAGRASSTNGTSIYSEFGVEQDYTNGNGGSSSSQGSGGDASLYTFGGFTYDPLGDTVDGGGGGDGGGPGLDGQDGGDGSYSNSSPITAAGDSVGGSGGSAGNAVVQSGGTVTFVSGGTGDIRGSIV